MNSANDMTKGSKKEERGPPTWNPMHARAESERAGRAQVWAVCWWRGWSEKGWRGGSCVAEFWFTTRSARTQGGERDVSCAAPTPRHPESTGCVNRGKWVELVFARKPRIFFHTH